jgi:hypothetical protein
MKVDEMGRQCGTILGEEKCMEGLMGNLIAHGIILFLLHIILLQVCDVISKNVTGRCNTCK